MFWNKKYKKGFIELYTLIIVFIVFVMLMFSFRLEIMKKRYNNSSINLQLAQNEYEKYRIYLFNNINKYIADINDAAVLTIENIHNILKDMDKVYYNSCYLEYDKENRNIIIHIFPETETSRVEYYSYSVDPNTNKIIFNIEKIKR